MATATKGRRKARQRVIEENDEPINDQDMEIDELVAIGEKLDEARTKRISLQAQEKEYEEAAVECMKKHDGLMFYKLPDGRLLKRTHEEKDKVKIEKAKQDGETDFGD
jgi:hypothetical protein